MKKFISRLWFSIAEIGVQNHFAFDEKVKIRLLNKIFLLGIICALNIMALAPFTPDPLSYLIQVGTFVFLQVLVLVLHYYQHIIFARYFSSFIFPITTAALMVYSRGHFGEGYIFVLSIFMTFILYNNNLLVRNALILLKLTIYLSAAAYVYLTPYPITDSNSIDEHLVFIMCILAMGLIILLYQKELNKNQHRQQVLIDKLRDKNEELSDINSELERFTYIASHDLKSPLRTIINFLEVIEHNIKKKRYGNLSKTLKHVKTGAQQMNYIVTDILEYSSINNTPLEKTDIDLNKIFERVKTNLSVEIQERNVIFDSIDLPTIHANDIEFITLFQNLIENGIKYNRSKEPKIGISLEFMEEAFSIKFQDNGIGIESKYHNRIFELFQRLHTTSDFEGTGLGLGICSKIIKIYQGDIWVESMPDQGSLFVIQFPNSIIVSANKSADLPQTEKKEEIKQAPQS